MRRLLILSTTFFPHPVVGAVRLSQWCRFLPEFGWKPTVITKHYGYTADKDNLATSVHNDVRVRYLGAVRPDPMIPSNPNRRLSWKRRLGNTSLSSLIVPDPSIVFWRRSRPAIVEIAREEAPDAILTSSPSHAVHSAGSHLAGGLDLPWVADFRDPYLIDPRYRPRGFGRLAGFAHKRFERMIYEQADLITHAIPLQTRSALECYPFASQKIRTLTNGYPPELVSLRPTRTTDSNRRTVLTAGSIAPPDADMLIEAVAALRDGGIDLELRILGGAPSTDPKLRARLGNRLVVTGWMDHRSAIQEIANADILVNFNSEAKGRTLALSSKLFEYLATESPLVVINPTAPDEELTRGLPLVWVVAKPSQVEVRRAVSEALERVPSDRPLGPRLGPEASRRHQAKQLADWLDSMVAEKIELP